MNTKQGHLINQERKITLNASEIALIDKPNDGQYVEILIEQGITRIAAYKEGNTSDITLAFACKTEACIFNHPDDLKIKIEALINTSYIIRYARKKEYDCHDSIMDWILEMHIIRHERNIENRLMKLFQLLITRLGKRTPEGYVLEHNLSHARIAEIIGSTRSTVSRTISTLRKSQKIYIDELKNQLLIPAEQINDHSDMYHPST